METTYINLKQERDFGEVFGTTFSFIKQEFNRFGRAMLYFVVPVLFLAAIIMVFVSKEQQAVMSSFSAGSMGYSANPFSQFSDLFGYYLVTMLLYIVAFTSIKCTVYGYIKLYVEKGRDGFDLNDLWNIILQKFFPVLGISIAVGFVIGVGTMFCLIPGIYLGVSLCVIYMAYFYEGQGFSDAFSRSFDLTKQNWWLTLGLLVVIYLAIYVVTLLFSLPTMIFALKPMLSNMDDFLMDGGADFVYPTSFYIVSTITNLLTYLLTSVPAIMLGIQYFSLVETKEKPTLAAKIDQIQ